MTLPVSSCLASASQTCVVRPPWVRRASQMTVPSRAAPRKLAFNSMVVKLDAPSGSETTQP